MIRRTLFLLAFFLCAAECAFGEDVNQLSFPGNRFSRENIDIDDLPFWPGKILVQFVGIEQDDVQLRALASVLSATTAARSDMSIIGFPDNIFRNPLGTAKTANFLIFGYDAVEKPGLLRGAKEDDLQTMGLFGTGGPVRAILEAGLYEQSDGCLSRWQASQKNEIEGYVLGVSKDLPVQEKIDCIRSQIPTAFGVSPATSYYTFTAKSPEGIEKSTVFFDASEIALELSVAAVCREDLKFASIACPPEVISSIYKHHAELVKQFGEVK